MQTVVPVQGKTIRSRGIVIDLIMGIYIYSTIFLIVAVDMWAFFFQKIFFRAMGIPPVKRSDYFVVDRHELSKLSFLQRLACVYCSYSNGVVAWVKDVIMQIEIHSCAIKHKVRPIKGQSEPERDNYYEYSKFE